MKKLVMFFAALSCAVLASAEDYLPVGTQIALYGRQAIVVDLGGEIGKVAIATCNVGADTPSDMGTEFSSWSDAQQGHGLTDGWYIPSSAELEALCDKFSAAGKMNIEWEVADDATLLLPGMPGTGSLPAVGRYASSTANTCLTFELSTTAGLDMYVCEAQEGKAYYVRPFHRLSTLTAITYTGTGLVTPYNTSALDATYLTSFYDEITREGYLLFDGEVTRIGFDAFFNRSFLTSVTIPVSVTTIDEKAFHNCASLKSVTLPNSVTTIGQRAFYNCKSLKSVTLPNSVTTTGPEAFYGCTSLTSVTISNSMEVIAQGTFSNCTSLTSVTIPSSVLRIETDAFANCPLADVDVYWYASDQLILSGIPAEGAFNGVDCSKANLHVPYGEGEKYRYSTTWCNFNIQERCYLTIVMADGTKESQGTNSDSDLFIEEYYTMVGLVVEKDVDHVHSFQYRRYLAGASGTWQCWYMPIEASVSDFADADIDVAEVAGILFDEDNNAVIAFKKMKAGETMNANTPYVVRTSSSFIDVTCYDVSLKATAETSFYTLSASDKFTFTGNYTSRNLTDTYTLNTRGEFQLMGASAALKPMRFGMTIESRADDPYREVTAAKSIAIRVLGDDATDIDDVIADEPAPAVIYDLMGRRVTDIQSGEVYIMNGKKYIAK